MLGIAHPGLQRRFTLLVIALHRLLYRVSGGRLLGRVAGMPVLLLTTTGRRSGKSRTTPLTYMSDGEALVLVASAGGSDRPPAWALNLDAHPEIVVRRGRDTAPMSARRASDVDRERLWPDVVATYRGYGHYQASTSRVIPLYLLLPR